MREYAHTRNIYLFARVASSGVTYESLLASWHLATRLRRVNRAVVFAKLYIETPFPSRFFRSAA